MSDLSGTHLEGRTNADVTLLRVGSTSWIEEFPSFIFSTFLNLETVNIVWNRIRHIDLRNCGSNLKNLQIFQSLNRIPVLQNGAFSCHNLETILLAYNEFDAIEEFAFDGMSNLIAMEIEGYSFHVLHQNQFRHQGRLESLRLNSNSITSIHGGAFQSIASVYHLSLQSNQLEMISSGTFTNMPNLIEIFLGRNYIQTIEAGSFANLPFLQSIDLNLNPIIVINSQANKVWIF